MAFPLESATDYPLTRALYGPQGLMKKREWRQTHNGEQVTLPPAERSAAEASVLVENSICLFTLFKNKPDQPVTEVPANRHHDKQGGTNNGKDKTEDGHCREVVSLGALAASSDGQPSNK